MSDFDHLQHLPVAEALREYRRLVAEQVQRVVDRPMSLSEFCDKVETGFFDKICTGCNSSICVCDQLTSTPAMDIWRGPYDPFDDNKADWEDGCWAEFDKKPPPFVCHMEDGPWGPAGVYPADGPGGTGPFCDPRSEILARAFSESSKPWKNKIDEPNSSG